MFEEQELRHWVWSGSGKKRLCQKPKDVIWNIIWLGKASEERAFELGLAGCVEVLQRAKRRKGSLTEGPVYAKVWKGEVTWFWELRVHHFFGVYFCVLRFILQLGQVFGVFPRVNLSMWVFDKTSPRPGACCQGLRVEKLTGGQVSWAPYTAEGARDRLVPWAGWRSLPKPPPAQSDEVTSFSSRICNLRRIRLVVSYLHFHF